VQLTGPLGLAEQGGAAAAFPRRAETSSSDNGARPPVRAHLLVGQKIGVAPEGLVDWA
jgi:hypothetical protein